MEPQVKRITEKDAGRRIALRVEEKLEVVLSENPTTGFLWRLAGRSDLLVLEEDRFLAPDGGGAGGGGGRKMVFRPVRKGREEIAFDCARPWKGEEAARSFRIRIEVV